MQLHDQQSTTTNPHIVQSCTEIATMTKTLQNHYGFLNTFELEMSRLSKIPSFNKLIDQIKLFNRQLEDWKQNKYQIKNFLITYHLYQNLSARLRYICNVSQGQASAVSTSNQIMNWFYTEKPKLRCQVEEIKASMKHYTPQKKELVNLQDMVQTNELKRQMLPYEMMSRTSHPGLYPPKDSLKEYKRKTCLPFDSLSNPQDKKLTVPHKSNSLKNTTKNKLWTFRQSVGTMMTNSTLRETKSSFKKTVTEFNTGLVQTINKQPEILEDPINNEESREHELERQKQVAQEELLEANLKQNINEEDEPEEQNILDEQDIASKYHKVYIHDDDNEELEFAEQEAKQAVQSTLRRNLKRNQQQVRSKLQQLNIKRNMMNWAKVKSKSNKNETRKLETQQHVNKFSSIAYQNTDFPDNKELKQFEESEKKHFNSTVGFKRAKPHNSKQSEVIVSSSGFYRSKSSNHATLESDIQQLAMKSALKTYQKYINHLPEEQIESENNEGKSIKVNTQSHSQVRKTDFRSMSLTSLASRPKKKGFSALINENSPFNYNDRAELDASALKKALSGKLTSLKNSTIYNALSIATLQEKAGKGGIYRSGSNLLSNPFFPKDLSALNRKKK